MCTSSSSMDSDEPEKAVIQKVPSIDRVRDQGGYRHRAAALCCRVFNQSTPGNEIEVC
jgi:hypothetical protein